MKKLPKGKHSVKGIGRTQPNEATFITCEDGLTIPSGVPVEADLSNYDNYTSLLYNEYIVYDIAQVNIKYLVKFKFDYKVLYWDALFCYKIYIHTYMHLCYSAANSNAVTASQNSFIEHSFLLLSPHVQYYLLLLLFQLNFFCILFTACSCNYCLFVSMLLPQQLQHCLLCCVHRVV